jgi:hypothetical protein
VSRASPSPFLEMSLLSLKNLALLLLASALIVSGCGDDKPPQQPLPAKLAFTVQPSRTMAGAVMTPAVTVALLSVDGKPVVPGGPMSVRLELQNNASRATLSGTTTAVTSAQGTVSFADLSLDKAGEGYVFAVFAEGLQAGFSEPFTITPPPPAGVHDLVFTQQPGELEAGGTFSPSVRITVRDGAGNPTKENVPVTLALGANPAAGTLSGTLTVTTADGVATFPELSLDKAGEGYTLVASTTGLEPVTSAPFRVKPGKAKSLQFETRPSSAAVDVALSPAVQVRLVDAKGNHATSSTDSITVALGTNTTGATLAGTVTVAAVDGVATFANLSVDRIGTYTLTAAGTGLDGATSASFDIVAGAATQLAFRVQPSSITAGSTVAPEVEVTALDARGNVAADFTGTVAVALGANPTGDTLQGTLTANAVAGVARFGNLSLRRAGTGYTLAAASTGLTSITSQAFNVTPAGAQALAFTSQPASTTAGTAFTPAVAVTVQDAFGNTVTGNTATVQLALANNPSSATLAGTLSVAAVNGVATFPGVSVNRAGTGYTLSASAGDLSVTSDAFNITPGAASQLAFSVQPSSIAAGGTLDVDVTALDAQGNVATGFTGGVAVALAANPTGDTLQGPLTANAAAGVARFTGLSLRRVGTGYTLAASSTGLTSITSQSFNVTAGVARALVFTSQPVSTTVGVAFNPAVAVTVHDAFGNTVTSSNATVFLALDTNPTGAALTGTTSVAAVNGVATFTGVAVDRIGSGYALSAAADGLTDATSNAFNIRAESATRLAFRVQPSSIAAGGTVTLDVEVTALDAQGDVDTAFAGAVTMALGANPTDTTLHGTLTANATAGVARFGNLYLLTAGTGYTLTASATGLTAATSQAFDVTAGEPRALIFTTQPASTVAGTAFNPAVAVTVRDAYGNTVTDSTATVQLALARNNSGATLSGTLSVAPVNGVATFPGVSVDRTGTAYTLSASALGLTGTSSAFNITPGPAARLVFGVQPSNVVAGTAIAPAMTVRVVDAAGNTVPSATTSITVAIGNNPGVGILNGTRTVSAVNGVATFSTLSITRTGEGYTLTASATGLTAATSAAFNVTPGAASTLAFFTNAPNVVTAGTVITPAVRVGVRDSFGNTVTGSTATITLSLSANPGSSTLGGTLTVNAVDGVATFPDLTLNRAANNYRFAAASPGLSNTTSALFNVTAGAAVRLAFTTQPPANVTAGATFSTAARVTVQDTFGNTVTTPAVQVSVAIGNNPAGATLGGTTTVTTASGIATFSTITLDRVGTGYTLVASATSLTSATSNAFNVTAGAASQLAFTVPPSNATAGAALSPAVQVTVQDARGNPVTTATTSITLRLGNNPSGGALAGTLTVSAVGGVATFPGVSLSRAGTGYTLQATATNLTTATSAAFNVTAAAASRLAFTVQPSRASVGVPMAPAIEVTVQDAFGNAVTSAANSVTLALGNNPSGATLGGTLTVAASNGVALFTDLTLGATGTGYTLTASADGLTGVTSAAFDAVVAGTRLVYVDPAQGRRIALVRNPASTNTTVVLDLVAMEDLRGYSVGMNLPLDAERVQGAGSLLIPGTALPAGESPTAAYGRIPASGPLAGVLSTGQSQKAAGTGAVTTDSDIPAGSVLYTVQLALRGGAPSGVVFDGTALGPKFSALLRDRLGTDVVDGGGFAIGRLEVQ